MSFKALRDIQQMRDARAELDRRGWSYRNGRLRTLLWRATRGRYPRVGDEWKSWDLLETARLAADKLGRDDPVLDFGTFSSELPLALHSAGFARVSGIDLNPYVRFMPAAGSINYVRGSFHAAPFADASQAMITAISVIEHGYEPEKMLSEVARLLRPGGFFVASFDYWPDKIDTQGVRIFGLDWLILSASDARALIDAAARHGLAPVGGLDFSASERPIRFDRYEYTFGWLALQKRS